MKTIEGFLLAFILAVVLVPLFRRIAIRLNIVDHPNDRKIHQESTPYLGGFVVYFAVLIAYGFYIDFSFAIQDIFIWLLGFLLVVVGAIDDAKDMKATKKLLIQFSIALMTSFIMGGVAYISIGDTTIYFSVVGEILIQTLWIVVLINAFNLIDGLDGLASGLAAISLVFLWIAMKLNGGDPNEIFIIIMIGALLGFLYHNFYPSNIFLGDAGSMFIGYYIAVFAVDGYKSINVTTTLVIFFVAAIPILDIILSMIRRKINGGKMFEADSLHFHHRLLLKGFSQQQAVLIMYLIMSIYGISSIIIAFSNQITTIYVLIVLFILTELIVEYLYMLSDKYTIIRKSLNKIRRLIKN